MFIPQPYNRYKRDKQPIDYLQGEKAARSETSETNHNSLIHSEFHRYFTLFHLFHVLQV